MKRLGVIIIVLIIVGGGLYFLDHYWIHRYDSVIAREAARYHVDPDLVWSIAYEETYFSPWKKGRNGEIGLMQVTPAVAREWAGDNAIASTTPSTAIDANALLSDPQRNIQIACWYLQKAGDDYKDVAGREARMLAAYNAGPSRAADWNRVDAGARPLNEQEFIARIDIASTRAYVTSILDRYRRVKSARSNSLVRGQSKPANIPATPDAESLYSSLGPSNRHAANQ